MVGLKCCAGLAALLATVAFNDAIAVTASKIPQGAVYVAMGSSYAAGPGITTMATDSVGHCGQSEDNYARQFARAHHLKLIDRSCSGAVSDDLLKANSSGLPPQLDSVTADTRLVTVTVGGNDVRYMADFAAAVCTFLPKGNMGRPPERMCARPADFDLAGAFAKTEANLKQIAVQVRRRAPQARLVFVDYVTVLPPGPPCTALSISGQEADHLRARAHRLARMTARVAKQGGADLIKASALTRDHNACSADAWVAAYVPADPSRWGPVPFHPKLQAMVAIAAALNRSLSPVMGR